MQLRQSRYTWQQRTLAYQVFCLRPTSERQFYEENWLYGLVDVHFIDDLHQMKNY